MPVAKLVRKILDLDRQARVLIEDQFRTVGSIVILFEDKADKRNKILQIIKEFKVNSEEVI